MPSPVDRERGTTLLEVLVATVVLAMVATVVLSMLTTSLAGSAVHRDAAQLNVLLEDYAQNAVYEIELAPSNSTSVPPTPLFLECSAGASTTAVLDYYRQYLTFTYPTGYAGGYSVRLASVAPFDALRGVFDASGCTSGADASGLQELSILATAPDGESAGMSFVVRDPAFLQSDAILGL